MFKLLKNYNFNYLLITGAMLFCCTVLIYFFISFLFKEELNNLSRLDSIDNYFVFVLSALIIAPIFEEICFRGYFVKISFLKILSFIGAMVYIYITDNLYLFVPLLILVVLHFIKKTDKIYFFVVSSILFSLVHYKLQDFKSAITIIPMFFQFSLGLILTWVVLNFNLFKSIILHFLFNLFFIIITTIPLQFPESKINKIEYSGYSIEWNKVPFFNEENSIISRPNDYEVSAENIDIITLCKAFDSNSNNIIVNNDNKFYKFKFKIYKIDSTANKLDYKIFEQLLKRSNLVEN